MIDKIKKIQLGKLDSNNFLNKYFKLLKNYITEDTSNTIMYCDIINEIVILKNLFPRWNQINVHGKLHKVKSEYIIMSYEDLKSYYMNSENIVYSSIFVTINNGIYKTDLDYTHSLALRPDEIELLKKYYLAIKRNVLIKEIMKM